MGALKLQPALGDRFLSPDPIGFRGGTTNLYEAMRNNPLRYTDPSGLIVLDLTPGGQAGGSSGTSPIGSSIWNQIANDPNVVVAISHGVPSGGYGATQPLGNGAYDLVINPNQDTGTYGSTLAHELQHVLDLQVNPNADYSTYLEPRAQGIEAIFSTQTGTPFQGTGCPR